MKAKKDDQVKVHYTGTLTNGEVFDSSLQREPLAFTLGAGQMIKGFDDAVNGMGLNEKKTVTLVAAEAYGDRNNELMQTVPKSDLPDDMDPKVGQTLVASGPDGQQSHVVVSEVTDETITVDANHPLAGKDLIFEIELIEIA